MQLEDKKWLFGDKREFGKDFQHMEHVKCHGMFYKWVQWHNLAYEVTHHELKIPTLTMWYENYETNFNKTKLALFDFLEIDSMREEITFKHGKNYADYFTEAERRDIYEMIKKFAKPEIWEMVKRYMGSEEQKN